MFRISIHKFKDMDLKNATVVSGFPTTGLVSTVAANYLISTLHLDQISAIDSPHFPPVSMIYANKPKFPARIYADEATKVAVFLSEFTPPPQLARSIGLLMLDWAIEHKCRIIIIPEGLSVESVEEPLEIYAVGSTNVVRDEIERYKIKHLETGIITGVSGVLLNEGRRRNFDVLSLLAEVKPEMPDARAAARILEVIDKFIPLLKIDVTPLYREAERIERYLRSIREKSKIATEPTLAPHMYG